MIGLLIKESILIILNDHSILPLAKLKFVDRMTDILAFSNPDWLLLEHSCLQSAAGHQNCRLTAG